eukprot:8962853-Alexandrium_andersonii.AAC.1
MDEGLPQWPATWYGNVCLLTVCCIRLFEMSCQSSRSACSEFKPKTGPPECSGATNVYATLSEHACASSSFGHVVYLILHVIKFALVWKIVCVHFTQNHV